MHYSERRYQVTHDRIGGDGGAGGLGLAFDQVLTQGSPGELSTPEGGNSGGAGGAGGSWGANGSDGADGVGTTGTGETGGAAGYAINGISYLVAGSSQGELSGSTI